MANIRGIVFIFIFCTKIILFRNILNIKNIKIYKKEDNVSYNNTLLRCLSKIYFTIIFATATLFSLTDFTM